MRPIPVPATLAAELEAKTLTIAGPSGDLLDDEVRPVEAMVYLTVPAGVPDAHPSATIGTVWQLEAGELEALAANGGRILVAFPGARALPVTAIEVLP